MHGLRSTVSVLPRVAELCMHVHPDICNRPTLNVYVDFIRLFDCINCIKMFGRALPRPTGESTRGKGRKED